MTRTWYAIVSSKRNKTLIRNMLEVALIDITEQGHLYTIWVQIVYKIEKSTRLMDALE